LAGLGGADDARYQEALAILRAGRERLVTDPRPDMPGFRMVSPVETRQEEKYQALLGQEARTRAAIARGERALPEKP
jgi:hypothetical protein